MLAARLLGRKALGIEIDPAHYAVASERIALTLENALRRAALVPSPQS